MPTFAEIKATHRNNNVASASGVNKEITVEVLSADPALVAGEPRIWIDTTAGVIKFTHDGVAVQTVAETV